ncbi:GlsB/YeaQ/YmgE family stress response membrane protein [Bosea caraganae]|uniref:GlsB/YeaQ/YmgE family stress response membrane protein n=1 Tax=Bosea caraganae TaxID=2763117 RepID=A0A370KZI1_9HYPH|nr:GlsB/YeaQ/YmgE family stress response membrane protein [Bosea caraganae]RDJ20404.1 GlsB/YeaQ/YmgE family stress response membrane protein [Bosea caraganae]RDJ26515.1 GlsB/YeaQ/YmgE family stress response membrane protein [Bosea caraganae]
MNDTIYAALGTPGYGFFMTLLIGMLAGWIAERLTSSDHGIFTNMLVGVAGSFIGSRLAELVDIPVFGFFRTLIAAVIGAVVVITVWNALRKPRV